MVGLIGSLRAKHNDEATIAQGVTSTELMRRVAAGVLENVPWKQGRTVIVCGQGGNGGDGYALYLLMKQKGYDVDLVDFGPSKHAGAAELRALCEKEIIPFDVSLDLSSYQNIVDCIFGLGLSRPLQGEYRDVVRLINKADAFVISVDIPSGLSADGGIALGDAVEADVTIAVQDLKLGHFLSDGLDDCGQVGALDVGIHSDDYDAYLLEESDVLPLFPPLKRNVHKGSMGRLTIFAGCDSYSGAAVISDLGAAAFAFGDGLVKLCVPDSILYSVMNKITECTLQAMPCREGQMVFDENALGKAVKGADTVLFGNGIGLSEEGKKILAYLVENLTCPLVLDADALNLLADDPALLKKRKGVTVLTPHPREMSRLTGIPTDEILSDPLSYAKEFALRYGVIVLLKGASSLITDGKRTYLSTTGSAGMAKGGSGDLLAGSIAALIAGGREALLSAYGAAFVLGLAGELASNEVGEYSALPTDTHRNISRVVKMLSDQAKTIQKIPN